jgi:general secretion pathway protein A
MPEFQVGDGMYEQYFGFTEPPFSVTPDPRFSYTNSLYREAFATLQYGIEGRKGFIVITGEAGTGKTTLLRRFMRSVESTVHTAFIFNPHVDFIGLLRLILNELGIANPAGDKLTMLAQLNDFLIDQLKRDHIVSLLVDEAQELSDEMLEELRLLSNLETDTEKLIQIVLMGQPELERKLDRPELRQLKQRVAIRCRLAPLSSIEIAPYIDSRLGIAGYAGEELFDAAAVKKIGAYSKGIPRLINVICDNALLIAYTNSQNRVSAEAIDEAASELQLTGSPRAKVAGAAIDAGTVEEKRNSSPLAPVEGPDGRLDDEKVSAGAQIQSIEPTGKRNLEGMGIGVLMGVITLAGTGVAFYSQQSATLASFTINIEELVGVRWEPAVEAEAMLTPKTLHQRAMQPPVAQAYDVVVDKPNSNGHNVPRTQSSKAPVPLASTERRISKPETAGHGKPQRSEMEVNATDGKQAGKNKTKERSLGSGTFKVVDVSFVRDQPRSNARITGALEPGSRVRVQSKTGDYYRVRSLDKNTLSGYVHREDAFFEPAK